jgi:hypothetical protein
VTRQRRPSRPCNVCTHADLALINSALVAGVSVTALAGKYGVSTDSIYRHQRNHITDETRASLVADAPIAELAAMAAEHAGSLLDYLQLVRQTLWRNFQIAAEHGDIAATNNTSRALLEVLREIGRLTGELLASAPITNIQNNHFNLFTQSAAFADLQAMLVTTLSPFPEALAAVVAGLERLDAGAGGKPPSAPVLELEALPPAPEDAPGGLDG